MRATFNSVCMFVLRKHRNCLVLMGKKFKFLIFHIFSFLIHIFSDDKIVTKTANLAVVI